MPRREEQTQKQNREDKNPGADAILSIPGGQNRICALTFCRKRLPEAWAINRKDAPIESCPRPHNLQIAKVRKPDRLKEKSLESAYRAKLIRFIEM